MNNQKGISTLVVVIIIVVIVLIAVVALFSFGNLNNGGQNGGQKIKVNKEQTDVSKWNVYRTDQYGFEFKFPDSASVDDNAFDNAYAFAVKVTSKSWNNGYVAVIDHGNVGTLTLSEFAAKDLKGQGEPGATVKAAELNGYDGVAFKGKDRTGYYIIRKLDVYEISQTAGLPGDAEKVVNSFRFIEQ